MNGKDCLYGPAIDGVAEADYVRMMPGVLVMEKRHGFLFFARNMRF